MVVIAYILKEDFFIYIQTVCEQILELQSPVSETVGLGRYGIASLELVFRIQDLGPRSVEVGCPVKRDLAVSGSVGKLVDSYGNCYRYCIVAGVRAYVCLAVGPVDIHFKAVFLPDVVSCLAHLRDREIDIRVISELDIQLRSLGEYSLGCRERQMKTLIDEVLSLLGPFGRLGFELPVDKGALPEFGILDPDLFFFRFRLVGIRGRAQ